MRVVASFRLINAESGKRQMRQPKTDRHVDLEVICKPANATPSIHIVETVALWEQLKFHTVGGLAQAKVTGELQPANLADYSTAQ
jgi:hypothetical protein